MRAALIGNLRSSMDELGWIENLSTRGEAKDKVGAFVCEVEEPSHLRGEKDDIEQGQALDYIE